MRIDLGLSPFDAHPSALGRAAAHAEAVGVTGLWTMDHLAGTVHHGRRTVLEGLSSLAMLVSATEQCRVGPMVLNPALRTPVVLAQALSSLQAWSGGRLTVGMGAGGGGGRYGRELVDAGLDDPPAPERRRRLEATLDTVERVWEDEEGCGYLHPKPRPPIIIGGYGPRMAELAGRRGDGFNTVADHHDLEHLAAEARTAAAQHRASEPRPFEMSVFALHDPVWLDPATPARRRLDAVGVDTLVLILAAPHDHALIDEVAAAA